MDTLRCCWPQLVLLVPCGGTQRAHAVTCIQHRLHCRMLFIAAACAAASIAAGATAAAVAANCKLTTCWLWLQQVCAQASRYPEAAKHVVCWTAGLVGCTCRCALLLVCWQALHMKLLLLLQLRCHACWTGGMSCCMHLLQGGGGLDACTACCRLHLLRHCLSLLKPQSSGVRHRVPPAGQMSAHMHTW